MGRTALLTFCLAIAFTLQPATTLAQNPPADSSGILETILLPALAQVLRDKGIPAQEVQAAVTSAERNHLPPSEAADIFRQTATSVDEHGPIDNFGAFVQQELKAGLRGRDLAAAIRAEHARRGIGKGKRLKAGSGPRGGPGAAERGAEQERGAAAGQGREQGRQPAAAGKGRAQERKPTAAGKAGAGRGAAQKERDRKPARPDTVPPPRGGRP
ncbi:MAG: hypothetical protein P8Z36_15090 [Gemmatimonadota bacterium]